ncbi:MAG TPA: outer membrane lipid asymmetry maintenance protein MlaD [Gammaproteobacteria bacterium]
MFHSRSVEILVGLFIAAGMAALFMLAMKVSNLSAASERGGYDVTAKFQNISGLKERSAVMVAGVKVGRVSHIGFDPQTFEAVVTLHIGDQYNMLPTDTSASILTSGLLGEKYVGLEPGGEESVLKNGDTIRLTQSAVILEQLIGQLLYSKASEGGNK